MKFFAHSWFAFLGVLLLGSCDFSAGAGPSLSVPDVWVFDLKLNDTGYPIGSLSITCTGDRPLDWDTKVSKKFYGVEENVTEKGYTSTLTIQSPMPEDSGYFNCSYEGGQGSPDHTYVYIDDGETGFVDQILHQPISVEIGREILFDCRTTNPEINVTIHTNREDVSDRFEVDHLWWFRKTAQSLQETGMYSCRESRKGKEKTWLVDIKPRSSLPIPSIEKHRNSYHVIGVEFSLNCTTPIEKNDDPKFEWQIPHPSSEKEIFDFKDKSRYPNVFATSILTIKSPTMEDSGMYKCIVSQDDNFVDVSLIVDVQESINPFVKFQVNVTHYLLVNEGENFQWVLYFNGFPNSLHYQFYDNFKKKLEDNEKISTSYIYEEGKLSLQMSNVSAENFGNYSAILKTSTGQEFDETSVILFVKAAPKVSLDPVPSVVSANQVLSATSRILAYVRGEPQPAVEWTFHTDCPQGIGSCDTSTGIKVPQRLSKDEGPANRHKSDVAFTPTSSGLLKCEVSNKFGRHSTSAHINVSDKKETFLVSIRTEEGDTTLLNKQDGNSLEEITLIEGDDVTIECYALNFNYERLQLSPNASVSNCDTALSSGQCMRMADASVQDEGTYRCSAVNRISKMKQRISFRIAVVNKFRPVLLPDSNVSEEGGAISVEASKPFSLLCFVDGRPDPRITWFKDGENIEEIPNYVDNKERVFLRNRNQILEFKFAQKEYEGKYVCSVANRVGTMQPYTSVTVQGIGLSTTHWVLVGAGITFILFLIFLVLFLFGRVKKESKLRNEFRRNQLYIFEKGNVGDLNKECTIDEQADLLPYNRDFEVEKERIKLGKQLGAGAFGRVMQADVEGLEEEGKATRVAVKMVKDGADVAHLRALTLELKIMVHMGKHLNIVNLMGAHTANMDKGDLWILVEYCRYGNLLKFMQRFKPRFVNQVDHSTGYIDINRVTPIQNDPMSPPSIGMASRGSRSPNTDEDGYLETRSSPPDYLRGSHPLVISGSPGGPPSETSSGTSRPGLYVGNPHYATAGFITPPTEKGLVLHPPPHSTSADHYVTATQLPGPQSHPKRHESTASNPSTEGVYHMTHTEMTGFSSGSPPFSPNSTMSGDFFFDSQGNPITFDNSGIPGVSAPFCTTDLICWAWQVANGMEYLTNRKVLHGDLAARNLLLAANNVVKISDFGLSRDIYKSDVYMKKGDEIMPIKWMAPEAIQQKIFSIQSDVWAYGITLWEMFSLGNTPYPGVPVNQDFPIALEKGMRMEKPKYCNDELYSLMLNCWRMNPLERPSFSRIAEQLAEMLSAEGREAYMSMNTVNIRRNEAWMKFNDDYLNMVSSPDFKNINSPMEVEGTDPLYIRMQTLRGQPDGGESFHQVGYVDMRCMEDSPAPPESVFSPRPPLNLENQNETQDSIFTFDALETGPFSEDLQSPAETSNLLGREMGDGGTGGVEGEDAPSEISFRNINNNNNNNNIDNINNINNINKNNNKINNLIKNPPLYQNLEKLALAHARILKAETVDDVTSEVSDDVTNEGAGGGYINVSQAAPDIYMNTIAVV